MLLWISNTLASNQRCLSLLKSYCPKIDKTYIGNKLVFNFDNASNIPCSDNDQFRLNDLDDYLNQLDNVDISDILKQEYIFKKDQYFQLPVIETNDSPGRFRNEELLKASYGSTKNEIESNLKKINFLGKKISFNKKNGAAKALSNVSYELTKLGYKKTFWEYRYLASGYGHRKISGTNRLSVHSYGIALDFMANDSSKQQYWKWDAKCRTDRVHSECRDQTFKERASQPEEYLQVKVPKRIDQFQVPNNRGEFNYLEIVKVFEKYGFIWGGTWYHYDTMHFEYRPEFLGINLGCN